MEHEYPCCQESLLAGCSVLRGWTVSDQIRSCLTSVLAKMISFLMIAVTATFPGSPAFRSCRYLARRSGLYRVAAKAAM